MVGRKAVCGKAKGTTGGERLNQVIEVYERKMRAHLREAVRRTVEQTLNALLDAEDRVPRQTAASARQRATRERVVTGAGCRPESP